MLRARDLYELGSKALVAQYQPPEPSSSPAQSNFSCWAERKFGREAIFLRPLLTVSPAGGYWRLQW